MQTELATGITGGKGLHPRRTASREASRCSHTVPFSPCSAHFSRAQCTLCYFRKRVKCQEGSWKLGGICRCFMNLGNFRLSLSEQKHLLHSLHMTPHLPSGPRTPQRGEVTFTERRTESRTPVWTAESLPVCLSFLLPPGESPLTKPPECPSSHHCDSLFFLKHWFPGGRDHRPSSNSTSSLKEVLNGILVCIDTIKWPWPWIEP